MHRRLAALLALVLTLGVAPALAASPAQAAPFPDRIELPPGFQPEGIAVGRGTTFYVGSIPTGAVYAGDLRTGEGDVLVPAQAGRAAIGLEEAGGVLWVAGGPTGKAFLYDAATGDDIAQLTLTTAPSFINDVVVTREAAYFTDSVNPFLYRVDRHTLEVTAIPLTGDLVYLAGFNVNGIDAAPDGKTLVLVQSNTGKLFTADAATGVTEEIDLGGATVPAGDGILLAGKTLYVMQNRLNLVAKVELSPDLSSGEVVSRTGAAGFQVPTTLARFGNRLYAVNARFGTTPTPTTDYAVIGLPLP
jgi:sugar lactone lactonase YvrE